MDLKYLTEHWTEILLAVSTTITFLVTFIFPLISFVATRAGKTEVAKFFNGLGLDLAKSNRALQKMKAPTADELIKAVNESGKPDQLGEHDDHQNRSRTKGPRH